MPPDLEQRELLVGPTHERRRERAVGHLDAPRVREQIVEQPRDERGSLRPQRRIWYEIVRDRETEEQARVLVTRRRSDPVHLLAIVRRRVHPIVALVGPDLLQVRRVLW